MTFYRLTQDIDNPKIDRRRKHDWRSQPTFKDGSIFVFRDKTLAPSHAPTAKVAKGDPRYEALRTGLEKIEPRLRTILEATENEVDPVSILAMLVRKKYVTNGQVHEVTEELLG